MCTQWCYCDNEFQETWLDQSDSYLRLYTRTKSPTPLEAADYLDRFEKAEYIPLFFSGDDDKKVISFEECYKKFLKEKIEEKEESGDNNQYVEYANLLI
mmetsp:Transcript_11858/g.20056  ORF Transcript_11858/g.20056 Transcript_11858/m.20056 type:complete len:99 (+) Transcript_11858:483-779(+)